MGDAGNLKLVAVLRLEALYLIGKVNVSYTQLAGFHKSACSFFVAARVILDVLPGIESIVSIVKELAWLFCDLNEVCTKLDLY